MGCLKLRQDYQNLGIYIQPICAFSVTWEGNKFGSKLACVGYAKYVYACSGGQRIYLQEI